jgi:hypothetical protein
MSWYKHTYPEEYEDMMKQGGEEAVEAACRKAMFAYLAGRWDTAVKG